MSIGMFIEDSRGTVTNNIFQYVATVSTCTEAPRRGCRPTRTPGSQSPASREASPLTSNGCTVENWRSSKLQKSLRSMVTQKKRWQQQLLVGGKQLKKGNVRAHAVARCAPDQSHAPGVVRFPTVVRSVS